LGLSSDCKDKEIFRKQILTVMGRFDKVKKNIKHKKRKIHYGYIILLVGILVSGYFIGSQYERTKQDEYHKLGKKYDEAVGYLNKVIESQKIEINVLETYLDSIPLGSPVTTTQIASGYGYRVDPFDTVIKFHPAVDLNTSHGQELFATGDGVVGVAGWKKGYGLCVKINHSLEFSTVYAHLSKLNVAVGDSVKKGDVIGYAGSTGRSTSVHLHYEVRKQNLPLNPADFLSFDVRKKVEKNVAD